MLTKLEKSFPPPSMLCMFHTWMVKQLGSRSCSLPMDTQSFHSCMYILKVHGRGRR